jgi:hypothetical protein
MGRRFVGDEFARSY